MPLQIVRHDNPKKRKLLSRLPLQILWIYVGQRAVLLRLLIQCDVLAVAQRDEFATEA